MAYNDTLVTTTMLQNLYGVPAVSSLGANKYLTGNDFSNYEGDWGTSFINFTGPRIVRIQDIQDKALVDEWRNSNKFNVIDFYINGSMCECTGITQNNSIPPTRDLTNVNIYLYHTYAYGHCLNFEITRASCSEGTTTDATSSTNAKNSGLVGIEARVTATSTNTNWKESQIYLWEAYDYDGGSTIDIYGNSTRFSFTFNSPVSIDGAFVKIY